MKTQTPDDLQIEEDTHRRDDKDSDRYSSSESCTKTTKSIPKIKHGVCKEKAISIVPGSNKEDEDSMLDNAVSCLKSIQERENILEEQNKDTIISKAWGYGDNNIGESSLSRKALPEIEAKFWGNDVLIRVHCDQNQKSYLTKVLGEIEKLHLNVENISSMPFGDYFLEITVTAKMNDEFFMTMKDLKRQLKEALQHLM